MNDLIYMELKKFEVSTVSKRKAKGIEFRPYAALVVALKRNGWRLRDTIEFFYSNIFTSIPEDLRVDNIMLSKLITRWKMNGIFNTEDIEREYKKLTDTFNDSSVNVFSSFDRV